MSSELACGGRKPATSCFAFAPKKRRSQAREPARGGSPSGPREGVKRARPLPISVAGRSAQCGSRSSTAAVGRGAAAGQARTWIITRPERRYLRPSEQHPPEEAPELRGKCTSSRFINQRSVVAVSALRPARQSPRAARVPLPALPALPDLPDLPELPVLPGLPRYPFKWVKKTAPQGPGKGRRLAAAKPDGHILVSGDIALVGNQKLQIGKW